MGKRLACPHCQVVHEYDVPRSEVTTSQREVRCRGCGHRFVYGFATEYVTTPAPEGAPRSDEPRDPVVDVALARERLRAHVARYPEYADRDRDVLLLHQLDQHEALADALAAIKRALDVIAVRLAR